ncbi:S8 family peptidase [Pseudonocardia sp. TRM90224]|uniref:S8 family peptidase n=1 Tax=Pseudonocardia sp. TRM90224 TaxID=2812678 RepID=UPI001E2BFEFA|nr:S8 family serine peptidase [Pseudonocardia sp. TRM90224]
MARRRWRTMVVAAGLALTVGFAAMPAGVAAAAPPLPMSTVFVELDGPSALQQYLAAGPGDRARARDAARAARATIRARIDQMLAGLRGHEAGSAVFRTTNAVPGFALRATPAAARLLAAQPGVRSVRKLTTAYPSNASADQLGGALRAWQQTGRLGTGVRIGIVDTGVDYTHADFGGPGTVEAFTSDDRQFPTEKVVGGVDLAGDDYDADSDQPARTVPTPDDDPMDCEGHGSHVAGTAAGYGVDANGATFRGDPRTLTPEQLDAMRIGPGSAPGASIYAIRVFGCSGSTDLTAEGLDHALDPDGDGDFADRLDIVNLSLGSEFGAVDDPVNDFVRVLTENGVLVVAAAGNAGDSYDAGGSPGNSPDALAVASVRDPGVLLDGIEIAGKGPVAGQYSIGYERYETLDVTGPVVQLSSANAQGCNAYGPEDAGRARGAVVWLEWFDEDTKRICGSQPRAENAAAAGAVGVVIASGRSDFGSIKIAGNAEVPMFQMTKSGTAALTAAVAAGPTQVRMSGKLSRSQQVTVPEIADTPSTFSARGVRAPTVKPDVAAPGESITSVAVGTGSGRTRMSGTSMASPFVAGVAAMVEEQHPDWSPAQLKAAIMGTATADVFTGENRTGNRLAPMRVGAGRIDARAALATTLLAADAEKPGAVSVTFGVVEARPGEPLQRSRRIAVTNYGPAPAALTAAYEAVTTTPGVRIAVTPAAVTVPAGGSALLDVTMRIDDPRALRRTADPTIELTQDGQARQYLADASGRVVLQGPGGTLRVPVSVAPKPVSDLTATVTGRNVELRGTGVAQGEGREAYRSRVGVFALAAESPKLPICEGSDVVSGCVANATGTGGDLRYIGVSSTVAAAKAAGRPQDALLTFAVATWADLYNVGSLTVPTVEMDVDGDNRPDFATELVTLTDTDLLVARTTDLRSGKQLATEPVNGLDGATSSNVFDTDAWVLPVRLTTLGIDPATQRSAPMRYRVVVHGEYGPTGSDDGFVDATDRILRVDPFAPPVAVAGSTTPLQPADARTRLTLDRPSNGPLLVVHGQNGTGARVAVVGDPEEASEEGAGAPWPINRWKPDRLAAVRGPGNRSPESGPVGWLVL